MAHALDDDVAYLKSMARRGAGRPAPLAWLLALFGLDYGLQYTTWTGLLLAHTPTQTFNAIMVPLTYVGHEIFLIGLIAACVQIWRTRRQRPKVNAVAAAGWGAALMALVAVAASFIMLAQHSPQAFAGGDGAILLFSFPSIALALYGAAWWVGAAATGKRWPLLVAAASFVAALAWAWAAASFPASAFYMIAVPALCLLSLAFAPGLALALEARRSA